MEVAVTNHAETEIGKKGGRHMLHDKWTVWYDNPGKKVSQDNWGDFIKQLYTFDSVEDFWCLHNNILPPSKLTPGSNFHVFRHGVEPKWEDSQNQKGGKWLLMISRQQRDQLDDLWLNVLLAMIGENFVYSEDICGAVVSLRKSQDKLSLWTRDASNVEAVKKIGRELKKHLELKDDVKIGYQSHEDAMKRDSSYNNTNRYEL